MERKECFSSKSTPKYLRVYSFTSEFKLYQFSHSLSWVESERWAHWKSYTSGKCPHVLLVLICPEVLPIQVSGLSFYRVSQSIGQQPVRSILSDLPPLLPFSWSCSLPLALPLTSQPWLLFLSRSPETLPQFRAGKGVGKPTCSPGILSILPHTHTAAFTNLKARIVSVFCWPQCRRITGFKDVGPQKGAGEHYREYFPHHPAVRGQ